MPGRLLNFRKISPSSSAVDVSTPRRDSHHTHAQKQKPASRHSSPSPTRTSKRRSNGIDKLDKLANRLSIELVGQDAKHVKQDQRMPLIKAPPAEPPRPANLGLVVESPPLMLYNSPENSTGALFSGQLVITVTEQSVIIDAFTARFISTSTYKKSAHERCSECSSHVEEFHKWDFLAEPIRSQGPLKLTKGTHKFPLSYLISGKLPASTNAVNASISYALVAEAKTRDGYTLPFQHPLELKRAIIPGPEKHSIRIFPPTNLTAQVTLPAVIHPIGEFPLAMRIAGVTTRKEESQLRWKLRRILWRIEETQKTTPPPCTKHRSASTSSDSSPLTTTETRDIGQGELKTGWKTSSTDDSIEVEFLAHVNPSCLPLCNVTSSTPSTPSTSETPETTETSPPPALTIRHTLTIEMVISEEWSPKKKPSQSTPTGAARVLRANFNLLLTQRSGLGISWDEEQPPVYEDVPDSPPGYSVGEVVGGGVGEERRLGSVSESGEGEEMLPPPAYSNLP